MIIQAAYNLTSIVGFPVRNWGMKENQGKKISSKQCEVQKKLQFQTGFAGCVAFTYFVPYATFI